MRFREGGKEGRVVGGRRRGRSEARSDLVGFGWETVPMENWRTTDVLVSTSRLAS